MDAGERGRRDADNAMPSSVRRLLVVIAGGELGDRRRQFACEVGPVGRRGEPDVGVDRQRGERLIRGASASSEVGDLTHDSGRERQDVVRGELIDADGVDRAVAEQFGGEHIGACGGDHDALGEPASLPLFDRLHEPEFLEGTKVVVDLLARLADRSGHRRRRAGLTECRQHSGADRVEHGGRHSWVVDDAQIRNGGRVHSASLLLTDSFVSRRGPSVVGPSITRRL